MSIDFAAVFGAVFPFFLGGVYRGPQVVLDAVFLFARPPLASFPAMIMEVLLVEPRYRMQRNRVGWIDGILHSG